MDEFRQAYKKVHGSLPMKAWIPGFAINLLPYDFKLMMSPSSSYHSERIADSCLEWFGAKGYSGDVAALRSEYPQLQNAEAWLRSDFQ